MGDSGIGDSEHMGSGYLRTSSICGFLSNTNGLSFCRDGITDDQLQYNDNIEHHRHVIVTRDRVSLR